MPLSPGQRRVFFPLAQKAHKAEVACTPVDQNAVEFDSWRREQMRATLGKDSFHEYRSTPIPRTAFDAIMLKMATIAFDTYWLDRISGNDERVIFWRIRHMLSDLSFLEKIPVSWDYVRATYKRAGMLPEQMRDCPASTLRKVLMMLDTHVRRLCKDYCVRPCDLPSRSKHVHKDLTIRVDADHLYIGHDLDHSHAA